MRTSEHLNQFRNRTDSEYGSDDSIGMNGFFVIPLSKEDQSYALVICSDGNDAVPWEHISVRIGYKKYHGKLAERTPTWDEMCVMKDLFWGEDEVVMQLHPARSQYVNVHPNVLHLWKPKNTEIPTPPMVAV